MHHAQRPAGAATGQFSRVALLAVIVAAGVPALASAQVYDPLRGYALDGSPIAGQSHAAPRVRDYPVRNDEPSEEASRPRHVAYVSIRRIRRVANHEGFRLATEPHRRGHSYVALAENDSGHRFELIFNATNGNLVDQRDLGPVAVAGKDAAPTTVAQPAAAAPAPVQTAAAPAESTPAPSPDVAAARAEAEKAMAAAADAKRALEASAAESRRAQAKLAEAEATARREAQAREEESRRQEARAAEQRRTEARLAETKRRALAMAEAKLAQAKASRERADADMKRAEAEAADARAAMAPAEMTGAPPKTADATAKPAGTTGSTVGQMTGPGTVAAPAAAMAQGGTTPAVAMQGGGQDAAQTLAPTPDKAPDATAVAVGSDTTTGASTGSEHEAETNTGATTDTVHAKADTPDETPTGSMQQSPPEPYAAPEPDASESH